MFYTTKEKNNIHNIIQEFMRNNASLESSILDLERKVRSQGNEIERFKITLDNIRDEMLKVKEVQKSVKPAKFIANANIVKKKK